MPCCNVALSGTRGVFFADADERLTSTVFIVIFLFPPVPRLRTNKQEAAKAAKAAKKQQERATVILIAVQARGNSEAIFTTTAIHSAVCISHVMPDCYHRLVLIPGR